MSKKQSPQTLLAMAQVKVIEPRSPEMQSPPHIGPPLASPYETLLETMPGDPDMKVWMLDQLELSRSWGDSLIKIPSNLLIAILDKALASALAEQAKV